MPPAFPPVLPDRPRRLALLDPHPVLRLGVEVLLRQHASVQVRLSLSSERHLLHLLERSPTCVDLLLIDALPMGDQGDGLALLRLLSQRWPSLPVLVLSAHCNASTVNSALRAGRSASTISSQKTSAYRKLGIRGDGDLFRFRHLLDCG